MNRIEGSIGAFIVAFSFILAGWIGIAFSCQEAPHNPSPTDPVIYGPDGTKYPIKDGILELGPGVFHLSETIDLGKLNGLVIRGAGATPYESRHPLWDGQTTILIRTADSDEQPNYHFAGELTRFQIEDITLVNGGVHVQPSRSLGTGYGVFENVIFRNSTVEFGTADNNRNAANTMFRDCGFYHCHPGVITNNSQNVDFSFENVDINRCSELIHVKGGGMVSIHDAYVLQTPLLIKVSGPGAKTGPENAMFNVDLIKYDRKCDDPVILHDTHYWGSKGRVLNATRVHFNRTNPGVLCKWDGRNEWAVNSEMVQNQKVILP